MSSEPSTTLPARSDRGVDGQEGVEEVGELDALGFGDEPEEGAVSVEAPRAAQLDQVEAVLVVFVEQLVGDFAGRGLVG